jgi:hypothetical protein
MTTFDLNKDEFPIIPTRLQDVTYKFENVLISMTKDEFGFTQIQLKEGGDRLVKMEVEERFSFEKEEATPLKVKGRNRIPIAGKVLEVLNDDLMQFGYPATGPSASDYMAYSGQRVLVGFNCTEIPETEVHFKESEPGVFKHKSGKTVYRIYRAYVKFP